MVPLMALCLPAGSADAEIPGPLNPTMAPKKIVEMFDFDKDGRISRIEATVYIIRFFDKLDNNRDDHLTPSELPSISAKSFAAADKNRDGKLTVFEYHQADFAEFGNFDVDRDGFVTADEITAFRKRKSQGEQ